jgi:hypothetical protein
MDLKLNYTLKELKQVVKKHLLLDDYRIVDVLLATVIGNLFPTDALWLLIIGASSSAKTELLNAIEDFPKTFFISDLTPKTLISGKKNSSMLPCLNDKIIVMKDFTTILSKRPDDIKAILSQLREIYDGKFSKGFGTGEHEKWSGHVGFVGACTPVYDRHYSVIGQMGERFLLYRIKNRDTIKTGIQALGGFGHESKMRCELKSAFNKFLNQFKDVDINIPNPSDDLKYKIVSLATFCGHGRCPVHRDRYTKEITYLPDPEGTPRLSKQLYHIGIALMTIHQEDSITDDIYEIVKKIGTDLIPKIRFKLLRHLYKEQATEINHTWLATPEVARGTGIHGKTTVRAFQDLSVIGLVAGRLTEAGDDMGKKGRPYEWQLTEKALLLTGGSEIFSDLDEQYLRPQYTPHPISSYN